MKPRFISPHPYTNQDIIALARGPIVYCVDDFDNSWVQDHFKSLVLDPKGTIEEEEVAAEELGEPYVGLKMHNAGSFLSVDTRLSPAASVSLKGYQEGGVLNFVPYALRDNRGGRGHMRVGIRRKTERC